jgi:cell wall-associated NlpC family hydrolase
VLGTTISVLFYLKERSRQAQETAKAQTDQLTQLAAGALRWNMRTDRRLDRTEILQRIQGDRQKKAIGIAIDLYEHRPLIGYTWGGKSPETGFDSSGYVAYVLGKAGVLTNPSVYWSGRLRKDLSSVPLPSKQPGDVVFYEGGTCMFYLGGPDDLSIGALPGGIATGKIDLLLTPEAAARY